MFAPPPPSYTAGVCPAPGLPEEERCLSVYVASVHSRASALESQIITLYNNKPADLMRGYRAAASLGLVASSTKYSSERQCMSEWLDSDISHVRLVE